VTLGGIPMTERKNFLLGKGESITSEADRATGPSNKRHPYTIDQARSYLVPQFRDINNQILSIPDIACPNDEAAFSLLLHPAYLAKSYHPNSFFREFNLYANGSKKDYVVPRTTVASIDSNTKQLTSRYFLSGKRNDIKLIADELESSHLSRGLMEDIVKIEELQTIDPKSKLIGLPTEENDFPAEIVLHHESDDIPEYIWKSFLYYCKSINIEVYSDKKLKFKSIQFIPTIGTPSQFEKLANFSYIRAIRPIRHILPRTFTVRVFPGHKPFNVKVPDDESVYDDSIKAAIFDGGISSESHLKSWTSARKTKWLGDAVSDFVEHGSSVTSAFLFGNLQKDINLPKPYCQVDHYRVLDDNPNPSNFYDTHRFIAHMIKKFEYDFVNLSIGPRIPIEDDDIDSWTASLDDALSTGDTLTTVAVGNDGNADDLMGLNRIQPPSDAVNALGIGSCDRPGKNWSRAPYSCVGPGRSPGIYKPDILGFGGTASNPFWVLDCNDSLNPTALATEGTSFASPLVLRTAAGIRALLGSSIAALGIKSLLIHCAENNGLPSKEIGWGRITSNLESIVTTPDHAVRVLYQGELHHGKHALRARIPLPNGLDSCLVTISATICYATQVDHNHPDHYTRAGAMITFRPHDKVFGTNKDGTQSLNPKSSSFFGKASKFKTEQNLRNDDMEWETVRHGTKRKNANSLHNPCFDIFYNPRDAGHADKNAPGLKYAMVITLTAPKIPDLYNQVLRQYGTTLSAMRPVATIPLKAS
jgi:subtilase family protein